jgi:hypothetical protein
MTQLKSTSSEPFDRLEGDMPFDRLEGDMPFDRLRVAISAHVPFSAPM